MTQNKIALVTGGNRGIGFEICRQLAQKGVTVILSARRLADAEYAAGKIGSETMQVVPLKLDVTSAKDIQDAARFIEGKFGRLDILINNAGVNVEEGKKTTTDLLRQSYEINTIAPYALIDVLLPLLEKSSAGRIVNQSSYLGSVSRHAQEDLGEWAYMGYCSSKAALNMLTVIWMHRLKEKNIKINAAHPGWVRTRMGGEEAPLSPADGAKTAIRLALLPDDSPTGKFFHEDKELPW
jgi:NAD(P)-dependent dehydrogenase (short-subunit alcohol dehydrogenase family)